MLKVCRLLSRHGPASIHQKLQMLQKQCLASTTAAASLHSVPPAIRILHLQQHSTVHRGSSHLHPLSPWQYNSFASARSSQPIHDARGVRHIVNSVAAPAPTIKHKWDSETAKKALASLADEPTEFANGVEVLDSIVKVYTVYSRWVGHCLDRQHKAYEGASQPGGHNSTRLLHF